MPIFWLQQSFDSRRERKLGELYEKELEDFQSEKDEDDWEI